MFYPPQEIHLSLCLCFCGAFSFYAPGVETLYLPFVVLVIRAGMLHLFFFMAEFFITLLFLAKGLSVCYNNSLSLMETMMSKEIKRSEKIRLKHAQEMRDWRRLNPEASKLILKRYTDTHKLIIHAQQRQYRLNIREKIFAHYGNRCVCCGEQRMYFLCLDHIAGGGNQHRRILGITSGFQFFRWIIKQNFPKGFRILCANCNMAIGNYGECPHAFSLTSSSLLGLS